MDSRRRAPNGVPGSEWRRVAAAYASGPVDSRFDF